MRCLKKCMVLFLCIFLIVGCGNKKSTAGRGISTTNSVDKVINNQIESENDKTKTTESKEDNVESEEETKDTINDTKDAKTKEGTVDYDLTQMNSDMVYATVYQMMVAPEEYEGKTFRISGNFYATYDEAKQKYYFYCIIQDATACCAQGMEFIWEDGSHIYPDEYPDDNEEVIVEGTFETYKEKGEKDLYCRLEDATLQKEK